MSPRVGWRDIDNGIGCYRLANEMTGMRGAQGYTEKIPYAESLPEVAALDFMPACAATPRDLVDVVVRLGRGRHASGDQPGSAARRRQERRNSGRVTQSSCAWICSYVARSNATSRASSTRVSAARNTSSGAAIASSLGQP